MEFYGLKFYLNFHPFACDTLNEKSFFKKKKSLGSPVQEIEKKFKNFEKDRQHTIKST